MHIKSTCLAFFCLLLYSHFSNAAPLSWKIGSEPILRNDGFVVRIESAESAHDQGGSRPASYCYAALSQDNRLLKIANVGDGLVVDLKDPEGLDKVKRMLQSCVEWANSGANKSVPKRFRWQSHTGVEYNVEANCDELTVPANTNGGYQFFTVCKALLMNPNDSSVIEIANCASYLYAVESAEEIVSMHKAAITQRDADMARSEEMAAKADAQMRAATIENAKAESMQRIKEAEAEAKKRISDVEMQKKLETIANDEAAALKKMRALVSTETARRVADYLATPEGIEVEKTINNLTVEINELQSAETQYIRDLQSQYFELNKIIARTTEQEIQRRLAMNAWLKAKLTFQDSEKLASLRAKLDHCYNEFERETGSEYSEGMAAYGRLKDSILKQEAP